MKKTSVFAGLSIAALLGTGIIAYAEPTIKEIKAYLNQDVTISFEGVTLPLTPITYNDTAYVPVRTLSHWIGADVSWNGQNNTIEITKTKYLSLNEQLVKTMKKFGYTIEAPKLLDNIRFFAVTNVEDSIARGSLDKGTLSAVIIQYMVQNEDLHKLHEDLATIEVMNKSDFQQIREGAKVLAEKGDLVYIGRPSTKNPFADSTEDFSNYEALALHLSTHSYYVKLLQDVEDKSILYENTAHHFTLKLPKSWEGKYDVAESVNPEGNSVRFINKATKVGTLFTISIWSKEYWNSQQEEITGIIPISKLGEYGDNVYFFHTPTDVQYDPRDEQSKADYQSMFNDIQSIISTFEIKK